MERSKRFYCGVPGFRCVRRVEGERDASFRLVRIASSDRPGWNQPRSPEGGWPFQPAAAFAPTV